MCTWEVEVSQQPRSSVLPSNVALKHDQVTSSQQEFLHQPPSQDVQSRFG